MGRLHADEMAGLGVDLDAALHWHLRSNHFPPVPTVMIAVAKAAIFALNVGDSDRSIALPEGVTHRRFGTVAPAHAVADELHLYSWITPAFAVQYVRDYLKAGTADEDTKNRAGAMLDHYGLGATDVFEPTLCDDGTMDTVVEVNGREFRYDGETASHYRDPDTGALDLDAFAREVVLLDIDGDWLDLSYWQ